MPRREGGRRVRAPEHHASWREVGGLDVEGRGPLGPLPGRGVAAGQRELLRPRREGVRRRVRRLRRHRGLGGGAANTGKFGAGLRDERRRARRRAAGQRGGRRVLRQDLPGRRLGLERAVVLDHDGPRAGDRVAGGPVRRAAADGVLRVARLVPVVRAAAADAQQLRGALPRAREVPGLRRRSNSPVRRLAQEVLQGLLPVLPAREALPRRRRVRRRRARPAPARGRRDRPAGHGDGRAAARRRRLPGGGAGGPGRGRDVRRRRAGHGAARGRRAAAAAAARRRARGRGAAAVCGEAGTARALEAAAG